MTRKQNRRTPSRNAGRRQRGVALVAALIALVLISAITAGMIILSTTETNISANFRDEQTAFFGAKAGIEEVRDRLRTGAANTLRTGNLMPTAFPGNGANGVLYILNPANGENVAPWNGVNYPDDEICKETNAVPCAANAMGAQVATGNGWYTTTTASATYAAAPVLTWKWVRITLKQNNSISQYATNGNTASSLMVCWNGLNEYADPNPPASGCTSPNLPVYVLTALAVTPSGSRRMVQTEVAEDKFPFTTPSALTLNGLGDSFSSGSSANWAVNGNDAPGCGVATTGPGVAGIGVTDGSAGPPVTGDVLTVDTGLKRPHNITGAAPGLPDGANVANISSTLPVNMQTVSSLQALVSTMKNNVTQPVINGPANGLSNPGSAAAPQIIYVNGDLTLTGNTTGYGILVVTGTLTMKGTTGWNGIVLVIGKGNLQTDGTVQYNGTVFVADTLDPLGNLLSTVGPGTMNVTSSGGGHGGIQYSSGCINQSSTLSTFHVMAIRELLR